MSCGLDAGTYRCLIMVLNNICFNNERLDWNVSRGINRRDKIERLWKKNLTALGDSREECGRGSFRVSVLEIMLVSLTYMFRLHFPVLSSKEDTTPKLGCCVGNGPGLASFIFPVTGGDLVKLSASRALPGNMHATQPVLASLPFLPHGRCTGCSPP